MSSSQERIAIFLTDENFLDDQVSKAAATKFIDAGIRGSIKFYGFKRTAGYLYKKADLLSVEGVEEGKMDAPLTFSKVQKTATDAFKKLRIKYICIGFICGQVAALISVIFAPTILGLVAGWLL